MTKTVASRIRKRQVCGALMAIVLQVCMERMQIRLLGNKTLQYLLQRYMIKSQPFTTSTNWLVCTIISSLVLISHSGRYYNVVCKITCLEKQAVKIFAVRPTNQVISIH